MDFERFQKMQSFYDQEYKVALGQTPISQDVMFPLLNCQYVVRTIVPMAEKPYIQVYLLDMAELKAFFFSLVECGETVISVEPFKGTLPNMEVELGRLLAQAPLPRPPSVLQVQCVQCKKWTSLQNFKRRPVPEIIPLLEEQGWSVKGETFFCPCVEDHQRNQG